MNYDYKQNSVNRVSNVLRDMKFFPKEDKTYSREELETHFHKLFTTVCGENAKSEEEMSVALTVPRENEILKSIGFNALDLRQTELSALRDSYDTQNYEKFKFYLETIKTQLRDGCSATFFGDTGSGKTNGMSLCFRQLIRAYYDAFTQTVNIGMNVFFAERLIEIVLEDNFNKKAWYCEVPILGIDDIYLYSDRRHSGLRWIVNERTSKGPGYLTFMTTRLQKHEFERCRDIYSRMNLGEKFWTRNVDFRKPW